MTSSSKNVTLMTLCVRFALDSTPNGQKISLQCISELLRLGCDPVILNPTPLQWVADRLGSGHERTIRLFHVLKDFFSENALLDDEMMFVALIGGFDIRRIKNWGAIVDLHEAVHSNGQWTVCGGGE